MALERFRLEVCYYFFLLKVSIEGKSRLYIILAIIHYTLK